MTEPTPNAPGVERKVTVAGVATYVGGVVGLAVLQAISDGSLLAALPAPYVTFLGPLVPAAITFIASYLAKHSPRSSGLGDDIDSLVERKAKELVDAELAKLRTELGLPAITTGTV